MKQATQCERAAECPYEPIGFIPKPNGDIHVCKLHANEAMEALFYVEYYSGWNNLPSLDKAIRDKHLRLRGNDSLKVDNRGGWMARV